MAVYGYARVSSRRQGSKYGLARQKKVLLENGVTDGSIIYDQISGAKKHRKGLKSLLDTVQEGDVVKCVSADRLGRSTADFLDLIEKFREKGASIAFIKEGIDTSRNDAMSNAFLAMVSVFAQLEREMMLERQAEAFEVMREEGIPVGRPPVDQKKLSIAVEMYLEGKGSYREISNLVGISPARICIAVKDRRESDTMAA